MSRTRKHKRKKIRLKRVFIFLIIIILITIGILSIFNFKIKNIYVLGNVFYSDSEIIKLANLDNYPSFLTTSLLLTEMKLEKNKLIKNASIKRNFWGVIKIKIEEYQPYFITNQNILILEKNKELKLKDLKNIIISAPYLTSDLSGEEFEELKKSFSKIEREIISEISEIEYKPSEYDDERFLFLMTDGNYAYVTLNNIENINYYNKIVPQLEGKKGIMNFDSYRVGDAGITIEILN